MSTFYMPGQDWRCPRCKRHILLDASDINDQRQPFTLNRAASRWFVHRLQTIACRNCREIVSTFGLYRVQLDEQGNPQRLPQNHNELITNYVYRELIVYPVHTEEVYDPNVVPDVVTRDYYEAASIVDLSPRGSAVLARRCLQTIMRRFFKVTQLKTLHQEINAAKPQMSDSLYQALMSLKAIGNIGAHPEEDADLIIEVEPEEATLLLDGLRYLIDSTYVKQHEDEQRLRRIKSLGDEKQAQRAQE